MEDTIKEFSGKILGTIRDEGSELVARNFSGKILGYYKKSSGTTTDFSGRILAYGNILSALIWQDAGH